MVFLKEADTKFSLLFYNAACLQDLAVRKRLFYSHNAFL